MVDAYDRWKPANQTGKGVYQGIGGISYETIPWKPVKVGKQRRVGELLRDKDYECAFCNGTGERPKGSKCPACRAQGQVSVHPPAVRCAFCKGTGEDKPRSHVTCLVCRGKGVVPVTEPIAICQQCKGTGRPVGGALYCGGCKGKGVVTVKGEPGEGEEEKKPFLARPSGTARDIVEVIYDTPGGRVHYQHIARTLRLTPAYCESICKQITERGYLQSIKRGVYALSPRCERTMQDKEDRQLEGLTYHEAEILKAVVVAEDDEVLKVKDIAKKTSLKIPDVNKFCNKLGERNFIDITISGKVYLTEKGERALEYIFSQEDLAKSPGVQMTGAQQVEEGIEDEEITDWESMGDIKFRKTRTKTKE